MTRTGRADPTGEEIFRSITRRMLEDPRVSQSKMFGASGLSVNGKYFAMLYKAKLVVKLSEARATQLVAGGEGEPFDPGHGRVMREWVAVSPTKVGAWPRLAREARDFVASATSPAGIRKQGQGRGPRTQSVGRPKRRAQHD